MNSRERVLKAFGKMDGMPDRVPIQFEMCRQLNDHFGKELGIPVNYTENLYEDVTYRISANELRIAMGSDVVITGASVSDDFKIVKNDKGHWKNEYEMVMRQGDIYVEVVDYPLAHAQTKEDIDNYIFPDVNAPGRFRDAEALVKKFKDEYLVISHPLNEKLKPVLNDGYTQLQRAYSIYTEKPVVSVKAYGENFVKIPLLQLKEELV